MSRKTSASHDEAVIPRIRRDPKFAVAYLKAALRRRRRAGSLLLSPFGISPQAQRHRESGTKAAGVEARESLSTARCLYAGAIPAFRTLVAVTKAIGLKLTVEAAWNTSIPALHLALRTDSAN